jgi:hypothetical protein
MTTRPKRPTAADFDRFRQKMIDDINRTGRTVICVGDDIPFAYTIGNQLVDLPELLVIGTIDGRMLNPLSTIMIGNGRGFHHDEVVSIGGALGVKIIDADIRKAQEKYTIQAGRLGRDYRVQQVLIPDRVGRFPDDPRCEPPYSTVPILWRTQ